MMGTSLKNLVDNALNIEDAANREIGSKKLDSNESSDDLQKELNNNSTVIGRYCYNAKNT